MPFSIRNLSVLAYANGFTLWHYKLGASSCDAVDPGFFDDARDMLISGDMLMVSSATGGRMFWIRNEGAHVVTASLN